MKVINKLSAGKLVVTKPVTRRKVDALAPTGSIDLDLSLFIYPSLFSTSN